MKTATLLTLALLFIVAPARADTRSDVNTYLAAFGIQLGRLVRTVKEIAYPNAQSSVELPVTYRRIQADSMTLLRLDAEAHRLPAPAPFKKSHADYLAAMDTYKSAAMLLAQAAQSHSPEKLRAAVGTLNRALGEMKTAIRETQQAREQGGFPIPTYSPAEMARYRAGKPL